MTKIKVTMTNNSAASSLMVRDIVTASINAKHNGGKVVIITCSDDDEDKVTDELHASHAVASYEYV